MHADDYSFPFDVLILSIGLDYVGSIQKYMSCKGSCLASVGADQPAEVVYDAPVHLVIVMIEQKYKPVRF